MLCGLVRGPKNLALVKPRILDTSYFVTSAASLLGLQFGDGASEGRCLLPVSTGRDKVVLGAGLQLAVGVAIPIVIRKSDS